MEEPFSTPREEKRSFPVIPVLIGVLTVAVALAIVFGLGRKGPDAIEPAAAELGKQLQLGNVSMSEAQNMVGGTSTYIEGLVTNTSSQTVVNALVEVTFRDTQGEVAQKAREPLAVILAREPADDVARLNRAPLGPGKSREFRLTFEHVSEQWNRQIPEVQVIAATAQ